MVAESITGGVEILHELILNPLCVSNHIEGSFLYSQKNMRRIVDPLFDHENHCKFRVFFKIYVIFKRVFAWYKGQRVTQFS